MPGRKRPGGMPNGGCIYGEMGEKKLAHRRISGREAGSLGAFFFAPGEDRQLGLALQTGVIRLVG